MDLVSYGRSRDTKGRGGTPARYHAPVAVVENGEGGRDGGWERGREAETVGGREGGRGERGRNGGREGGREGGEREGGMEGGREAWEGGRGEEGLPLPPDCLVALSSPLSDFFVTLVP